MAFNLTKVLKVLLFSTNRPLTTKDIQAVFTRFHEQGPPPAVEEGSASAESAEMRNGAMDTAARGEDADLYRDVPSLVTAAQIREAMNEIAGELRAAADACLLIEGAQGYRLVTPPRFSRWIRLLRNEPPPVKLTPVALETLAVIAYRQPVTRAEIEHIRGVSAEAGLARLLERELIYIVGRAELPGRPIQYGTTDGFLEFLGIKSLDELPASDVLSHRQIDEWLQNAINTRHLSDREMGLAEEAEKPAAFRSDGEDANVSSDASRSNLNPLS